ANAAAAPVNVVASPQHLAAWLNGQEAGLEKFKPVNYYVMGDPTDPQAPGNKWRSEDAWPPAADVTPFYFHADGSLKRGAAPSSHDSKSYKYDPAHPVPTIGGQNLYLPKGPMNQKDV